MLADVLAPKQIKEDADSLQIWGKDWTNGFVVAPSAVVFPESIEQLQDLVAYARASDTKLVPSGGRTGLSGGAVASQGEVVVSFDRMNKILDFSEGSHRYLPARGYHRESAGLRRGAWTFLSRRFCILRLLSDWR